MKRTNSNIIVLNYIGVIQERNIRLFTSSIISKQEMIKEEKVKDILVSLKALVYENNVKHLTILINELNKLSQKIGVSISFIDYSMELFKTLKKVTNSTKIRLFKNKAVATLFLDPKQDRFDTQMQLTSLDYLFSSEAAVKSFSENYAGLPIES